MKKSFFDCYSILTECDLYDVQIYYEQEIAAISTDGQGWTAVAGGVGEDRGIDGSIHSDDKGGPFPLLLKLSGGEVLLFIYRMQN